MILALCLPHLNFLKLLFTLKILHFLGLRTFFLGVLYIYICQSTAFILINLFEDNLHEYFNAQRSRPFFF